MSLKQKILQKASIALKFNDAYFLYDKVTPIISEDCGIKFEFLKYSTGLQKRVYSPPKREKIDPLLPPFNKNLFVGRTDTNSILINKYMHMKGHVVLSALDKKLDQGDRVSSGDFIDISAILNEFKKGIAYYNCGLNSGCSQLHKHLQYTPLESVPLFEAMEQREKLPFMYRAETLGSIKPSEIEGAYKQMMKGLPTKDYNFIVNKKTACIIPRSRSIHEKGVVLNSIGMCGIFSITEDTDPCIIKHPMDIVTQLGIPSE